MNEYCPAPLQLDIDTTDYHSVEILEELAYRSGQRIELDAPDPETVIKDTFESKPYQARQ